jgi:hypothetical protein
MCALGGRFFPLHMHRSIDRRSLACLLIILIYDHTNTDFVQEVEDMTRSFAALRDASARLNNCRNTVTELSGQSEGAYHVCFCGRSAAFSLFRVCVCASSDLAPPPPRALAIAKQTRRSWCP